MDKEIEKKIAEKLGKTEAKALHKQIKKDVAQKVEKEVEKKVEKEVKKAEKRIEKELKFHEHMIAKSQNVYSYGKNSALAFKKEFQKHIITAISAALGFLIALSWRTPIQNSVNWLIDNFGLNGYILYEFLSAVLITIFAVFVLMIVTQWEVKK